MGCVTQARKEPDPSSPCLRVSMKAVFNSAELRVREMIPDKHSTEDAPSRDSAPTVSVSLPSTITSGLSNQR